MILLNTKTMITWCKIILRGGLQSVLAISIMKLSIRCFGYLQIQIKNIYIYLQIIFLLL